MNTRRRAWGGNAPMRRRSTAAVAFALAAVLPACTAAPAPTSAATGARAAASGAFVPGDGNGAGLVDIGGGRELYIECSGTGSPTVVLLSGAGVAADNWSYTGDPTDAAQPAEPSGSAVFPATAAFTRACAYDRPGTELMDGAPSRSTPVPQPTSAQDHADDLHALLAAAEVAGPLVVVGHSWGGLIATAFARTHPDDVVGLVLVDPGSQYLEATLPPDVWARWMQDIAAAGEKNPDAEAPDYPSSIAAVEAAPLLPKMPAVVLSADRPFDYLGIGDAAIHWPQWVDAAALLADSLGATHVTRTNSGHFIENENPALVNEQISAVVEGAQPSGR